jgi:hypothetical protein
MASYTITEIEIDGVSVRVGDYIIFRYRGEALGGEIAWFNASPSGLWLSLGGACHPSFPFQDQSGCFACRVADITILAGPGRDVRDALHANDSPTAWDRVLDDTEAP